MKCLQARTKRKLKLWTGLITVLRHFPAFISAKLKTRSTKSEVTATFTFRSNPALFDASGIKVSSQYSQASIILDDTIRNRGTRPLFPFAPANSRRELASQLIIAHRSYCFSLLRCLSGWDETCFPLFLLAGSLFSASPFLFDAQECSMDYNPWACGKGNRRSEYLWSSAP